MCYGSGCPFEVMGYGPSAGDCRKPKGAPCFMNYDNAEFYYIMSLWEEGVPVSEAESLWEEHQMQENEDDEDSDEEMC